MGTGDAQDLRGLPARFLTETVQASVTRPVCRHEGGTPASLVRLVQLRQDFKGKTADSELDLAANVCKSFST